MTIVPLQYFGVGDVIFSMSLVKHIADGRHIVWPVLPHFVTGLNAAYPDVTFIPHHTSGFDFEIKEQKEVMHAVYGVCTLLPIRWADSLMRVPYKDCMRAKYDLYGLDWRMWRNSSMWNNRPSDLADKVGATGEYKLINRFHGSQSQLVADIPHTGVEMSTIAGYSLFDWAPIIANATEIHTVSTSIIYLLEMLDLKAKEVHLYDRNIKGSLSHVDYILERHKYIFH